jgi:non-canonical (house-cleaning) NTP pyrophosphatase
MKVVLASQSALKIEACRAAFAKVGQADIELIPVKVPSGVAEQPFGAETLTGAFNRLSAAMKLCPKADLYIAIENGLFEEGGDIVDKAVILSARSMNDIALQYSQSVSFPQEYVEEAKQRGFDKVTVGDVMFERGYIQDAKDPHKSICGTSRKSILEATLVRVLSL